ncbi:MAG: hypothetical protein ACRENL_09445 [Candidatus Dormibacteria bacterium]
MDPTGLLDAVLAVAVYPGAAFLALAALVHLRLAGRPTGLGTRGPVPAPSLLPVVAAIVATAMLPLVGSPALRLPPVTGVAGNVVVVGVLLAVAVDLAGASRRAGLVAAAAAAPVLALAAAGSTLSVAAISSAGGAGGVAARSLAAGILVMAATLTGSGRAASVVAAALALTGAALVLPTALPGPPAIACALASLGVVALSGLLGRLHRQAPSPARAASAATAAAAGTTLALLSGRL